MIGAEAHANQAELRKQLTGQTKQPGKSVVAETSETAFKYPTGVLNPFTIMRQR